ncbi:caspase domain-containing protein [Armillaria borealis]|uniref:Caspase domain-containing protein n=1 Tax=Armillaria borealis TaxID=47425 RepID=A0AA39JYV9_9AGAR|nr:caspase domain-containing protein [Armillaria borealis]
MHDGAEVAHYARRTKKANSNDKDTTPPLVNDKIFALIIGISKYGSPKFPSVPGAATDAKRFYRFVRDVLHAPRKNIISLHDERATRSAIIGAFRSLEKDPNINSRTAAIIIYYAGHGAVALKPVEWKDWETSDKKIEMLCPFDMTFSGRDDKANEVQVEGVKIEGIPDRTINRLLLDLSIAKGNNITIILDCCHSAGINRSLPSRTKRQLLDTQVISARCDSDIYTRRSNDSYHKSSGEKDNSGFSGALWDSHILLAACGRNQYAWEENERGLFTDALLEGMEKTPISQLTYRSLMYNLKMPPYQTPQIDGKHILRHLFASVEDIADTSRIPCRPDDVNVNRFSLYAGTIHGFNRGSTFNIYKTDLVSDTHSLATATAVQVGVYVSSLESDQQAFHDAYNNHHLCYARLVKAAGANLSVTCNDSKFLNKISSTAGSETQLVNTLIPTTAKHEAELRIKVKDDTVVFDRGEGNSFLKSVEGFSSRLPCVTSKNIDEVRRIINHYARFGSILTMSSQYSVTDFITIEMRGLQQFSDELLPSEDSDNMLLATHGTSDKPIDVTVDTSLDTDDRPSYGFIVRHTSQKYDNLYVYLLYFDAFNLEIDVWYSPQINTDNQSSIKSDAHNGLTKGSILNLGFGNGGIRPIAFTVPDDQTTDVCFFKFFVATAPVDFSSLRQLPLSDVNLRQRGAVQQGKPRGVWASKVITVVQKERELSTQLKDKRHPLPGVCISRPITRYPGMYRRVDDDNLSSIGEVRIDAASQNKGDLATVSTGEGQDMVYGYHWEPTLIPG